MSHRTLIISHLINKITKLKKEIDNGCPIGKKIKDLSDEFKQY